MNERKDYEKNYKALAEKLLRKDWRIENAISEDDILKTEEKLGFKLPPAVRDYYKTVGRDAQLNQSHNFLVDLENLPHTLFDFKTQPEALFDVDENWSSDEDFLIFMTENQSVVYWALKLDLPLGDDPIVWQIVNNSPPEFYQEEKVFSEFIAEMLAWQFSFEDEDDEEN